MISGATSLISGGGGAWATLRNRRAAEPAEWRSAVPAVLRRRETRRRGRPSRSRVVAVRAPSGRGTCCLPRTTRHRLRKRESRRRTGGRLELRIAQVFRDLAVSGARIGASLGLSGAEPVVVDFEDGIAGGAAGRRWRPAGRPRISGACALPERARGIARCLRGRHAARQLLIEGIERGVERVEIVAGSLDESATRGADRGPIFARLVLVRRCIRRRTRRATAPTGCCGAADGLVLSAGAVPGVTRRPAGAGFSV